MSRTLIVHGGPILTMDDANPIVDAVGIDQGIVVATGSEAEVRERMPAGVETIHLDGRLATPGLYDAHAHVMGTGFALLEIDVSAPGVASIAVMRAATPFLPAAARRSSAAASAGRKARICGCAAM